MVFRLLVVFLLDVRAAVLRLPPAAFLRPPADAFFRPPDAVLPLDLVCPAAARCLLMVAAAICVARRGLAALFELRVLDVFGTDVSASGS